MIIVSLVLVFLILRFCVTLFNFISFPKLTFSPKSYSDLVTILIPARDEEHRILPLLYSIELQEYKNYEVIVLDDNSTDNTFEVVQAFANERSQFKVIKGKPLEEGWIGKNYACYQLGAEASGNYFLFLDADVEIASGAINGAVNRMKVFNLALLSLFADQTMKNFGERLVAPLRNYLILSLLPLRLVSLTKIQAFIAASSQFMLFDARIYRRNQWHKNGKAEVMQNVEIMKEVKAAGLKGEALLANGFISCRMYTSYFEGINAFSKDLLAGFSYSVFGLFIFLFLDFFGYVSLLMIPDVSLITLVVLLIFGIRMMISAMSSQSMGYNLFFHPLQMITLVIVGVISAQKYLTKTIKWKGRKLLR
ncbi:glycosyltransferase [Solitalea koreensis]|uniref:Chlorobactene glucosyltransferase n=1 Tax=Solitalea koreensis TaxID=543615 RepID=A0A521CS52_9SPHI|nr:glycosyltransferase family 2 protein [Solitalea koreensis]SMO62262.1 chlorobactene glucosyltransferase [Solitalea koreensis]